MRSGSGWIWTRIAHPFLEKPNGMSTIGGSIKDPPETRNPSSERHDTQAFAELSDFEIDEASVRLLSQRFCLQNYVVVLGRVDPDRNATAAVAMLDVDDAPLVRLVQQALQRPVDPVQLSAYEIRKAIDLGFESPRAQKTIRVDLESTAELSFDPDTPPADLLRQIMGMAVAMEASDIHIECYEDDVDLRFRIDGVLQQITSPFSTDRVAAITSRLKILADLDIAEKRVAQDGSVAGTYRWRENEATEPTQRNVDFRVSILPGHHGEDAVLRILDSSNTKLTLPELGFSPPLLTQLRRLLINPEGMLLVTGPTGSGKTTTLYAGLQEVNTDANKTLTVENPIEYRIAKVNQKQVSTKMGFADYARAFMRHDPDIMLIGEIRDEETANIAVRAAQTGHLVLSTLHTNDAVGTVARLRTLGIDQALVADCLLGSLAQRLMRRVCEHCAAPCEPTDAAREVFARLGEEIGLVRGAGCSHCHNTGYRGRVGVFELFVVDREMADQIVDGAAARDIRLRARQLGMKTLFDDALDKLRQGISTFEELCRIVPYRIIHEPPLD